jgi:2-hydroxychromene-2-carboxylate isomerase
MEMQFLSTGAEMSAAPIDFWFFVGSTYSYLSILRADEAAKASGVAFQWRPFNVRKIMIEQNNIPFRDKPVKAAYMWRDIARRAEMYGLTPKLPATYPLRESELANRIAVVGSNEGWCADYVRATYRRWFDRGEEPGVEPCLSGSLTDIGQDPARALQAARQDAVGEQLAAATEEAKAMGIFGSPTFVVDGELFWGDDRMDDAIRWRKAATLR